MWNVVNNLLKFFKEWYVLKNAIQPQKFKNYSSLTENSHILSHVKPEFHIWKDEFHIWNSNFTCEIKISYVNQVISHMKFSNSYVKGHMWNLITCEFFVSYMNLFVWNQITYEIICVKTNHILSSYFIYEILCVKKNAYYILWVKFSHIFNSQSINETATSVKIYHIPIPQSIYKLENKDSYIGNILRYQPAKC